MSATETLEPLPPPVELERICKGMAALDAILCAEWSDRYYSFNAAWAAGERMASMRNGCGDQWFLLFGPAGVFMKCFWHEYEAGLDAATLYAELPVGLRPQLAEAAFSMGQVTSGGWHDGTRWTLCGDAAPMADDLSVLGGDPAGYRAYAAAYFEIDVPLDAVAHVLAGQPIDAGLLERLHSERTLDDLAADLAEIGYAA